MTNSPSSFEIFFHVLDSGLLVIVIGILVSLGEYKNKISTMWKWFERHVIGGNGDS